MPLDNIYCIICANADAFLEHQKIKEMQKIVDMCIDMKEETGKISQQQAKALKARCGACYKLHYLDALDMRGIQTFEEMGMINPYAETKCQKKELPGQ